MNIKLFKKLIKESVIEAIHEELPDIINEVINKSKKQQISEIQTINFTSENATPLPSDIRNSLISKMGSEFGFNQPKQSLGIIDAVDESTGEKVNPYLAFIKDAADNMTPMDKAGLRNLE